MINRHGHYRGTNTTLFYQAFFFITHIRYLTIPKIILQITSQNRFHLVNFSCNKFQCILIRIIHRHIHEIRLWSLLPFQIAAFPIIQQQFFFKYPLSDHSSHRFSINLHDRFIKITRNKTFTQIFRFQNNPILSFLLIQ